MSEEAFTPWVACERGGGSEMWSIEEWIGRERIVAESAYEDLALAIVRDHNLVPKLVAALECIRIMALNDDWGVMADIADAALREARSEELHGG